MGLPSGSSAAAAPNSAVAISDEMMSKNAMKMATMKNLLALANAIFYIYKYIIDIYQVMVIRVGKK